MNLSLSSLFVRLVLLLLFGGGVFGWSLTFGFVPYDDPAYITGNAYVKDGLSFEGIRWAFLGGGNKELLHQGVANLWHPVTWISHMMDVELFGLDFPQGHHVMNVLFHLLGSAFLMLVIGQLGTSRWVAFGVALLWMIHPLKVESVAWVSERKDVLSGFFSWAALWCALKGTTRWYWAGWLLFCLALMSKPSVVILPGLVVLLEGYRKGEVKWGFSFLKRSVFRWWPWFAAGLFGAVLAIYSQAGGTHSFFAEQSSLISRLLYSGVGIWFYIWRTILPVSLNFHYPYPTLPLWGYILVWGAIVFLVGYIYVNRQQWRNTFVSLVWFCLCLLPVSGLFYVGTSFTADRYLYLALAGPLFLFVTFLNKFGNKGVTAGVILAVVWSGLSFKQVGVWKDGWTLFGHATKVQPNSLLGWLNLGAMHQEAENFQEAKACYDKALEIQPRDHIAWFNLGVVIERLGDKAEASRAYEKSLEAYPHYSPALKNLGLLRHSEGRLEEAAQYFERGVKATSFRDPVLLLLSCKTEFALGRNGKGEELLERLEGMNLQQEKIKAETLKIRSVISEGR